MPPKNVHIEVKAEVECKASATGTQIGYLDLLFCWGENEERRVIGIEVKFDADTKNNPFEAYEKKLRELADNQIEPLKILLVKTPRSPDLNWNQVFWQDLLPLWEEELKKLAEKHKLDQSLDYGGQLRASIINKVYGGLNV